MSSTIELAARGKLLLTGEYLVLAGARALAMPVRFGQRMTVAEHSGNTLEWTSTDPAGRWFSAVFDLPSLAVRQGSPEPVVNRLRDLLAAARIENPGFLSVRRGFVVTVTADYPVGWGLGSSSTLIYLVATWAGIEPFRLFRRVSRGSGYDIACADRRSLLFYEIKDGLQQVQEVSAGAALQSSAWFAWLGKKQESAREVEDFLSGKRWTDSSLERISQLAGEICHSQTPAELIRQVEEHERIVGEILRRPIIKLSYRDFPGQVKSLGAWGGDFVMFVSDARPVEVRRYLDHRGLAPVFSFNELCA
ncbi:MAG TPA: GYDIA family GHMP kinase [Bacteroidales bacterium]|nr:GYDIA family GHMP kinase [Bacteroidales bacterium]